MLASFPLLQKFNCLPVDGNGASRLGGLGILQNLLLAELLTNAQSRVV